jgi:hypothetical protein
MATTFIAQPQDFTPAYNECKFIVNSTNKNIAGFRYIFEVFEAGTANRIGYYKALPTFGTGYGEQDLSKLLSNMVSFDFNPTVTTFYDAVNSYYNYDIKIGEEYIFSLQYSLSLTNNGGNVRITATHPFQVGDQINIVQGVGGAAANPGVEGLHTVIAITGTTNFTINALWADVTDATINGLINYADNRKTVNLDIVSTLDKYVFNGVQPWLEMTNWDETEYELDGVTKEWLTNQPQTFTCTPSQDLWLNIKDPNINTNPRITFISDDGSVFRKTLTGTDYIKGLAVGPNNFGSLTLVSGTAPLIKNDTKSYSFYYSNGVFHTQKSLEYLINIDRRPVITQYNILFLDRMGSWSSFAFQLRSYEKLNIKRETYNKDVPGFVSGAEWQYKSYEQGTVNFNTQVAKTIDLNTNWMTEAQAYYFQELVTSPQTYIAPVTFVNCEYVLGDYISCNVMNNSFDIQRERNKHLIRQQLQVRLSNNDIING